MYVCVHRYKHVSILLFVFRVCIICTLRKQIEGEGYVFTYTYIQTLGLKKLIVGGATLINIYTYTQTHMLGKPIQGKNYT